MTLSLKHKFTSAIPDAGDPTIVQPSNWNDEHALTQATATILGRVSALTGPTEELTPAQARTLLNVADGATANSSDAFLLARANHTGTESADVLTDGTTNKAFLATERTKLAGIATGATANSSDAFLLARANHTGTQSADTLTDGTTNKAFLATERTKLAGIATGADVTATALNATAKGTPVDADRVHGSDSAASFGMVYATWTQVKAFLKTYFDTLYQPLLASLTSWGAVVRAAGFDTFAATPTSANLRALLSDEVGTGAAYFVGGALGTPASGTATNLTGMPGTSVINTPAGNIAATTVQAAINELDTEKIGGTTGAVDNALVRADGTGGQTEQSSTSHLSDAGVLRLGGTAAPSAEVYGVQVGNTPVQSGITFHSSRTITVNSTFGEHPFNDETQHNAAGGAAASFNAAPTVSVTGGYGHIAGLQHGTAISVTGTMADLYGHVDIPGISGGTLTNRHGAHIWEIGVSGGAVVTNQYGFHVNQLAAATNNWAFYSEGTTKSFIGGVTFDGVGGLFGVTSQNTGPLAGFRNVLVNGAMMIGQRGTSFTSTGSLNNDNSYTLDRWKLASNGNNIVNVTQSTTAPTNGLNSILATTVVAAKKFGFVQIIEQKNIIGLLGNAVTLSFSAAQGANLAGLKAAILSWTGTADAPTTPIVSAWNASGTTPTFAANWTLNNTPAAITVATTFGASRYSVSATLNTASTKNVAVFIWCDTPAAVATGDLWSITDVQLEIGGVATPFERRPWEIELGLAKAYYQKSFPYATAPAEGINSSWKAGFAWATTGIGVGYTPFSTTMRIAPTMTFFKPGQIAGTNGQWQWFDGAAYQTATATATATTISQEGFDANLTVTGATAKSAYIVQGQWTASAEL